MKTNKNVLVTALMSVSCLSSVAVASDWNGPYIGVSAGIKSLDADWTTTATYNPPGAPIPASSDSTESYSDDDNNTGLFVGYNWQVGSAWVLGAELDQHWSDNQDTSYDRIPGLGLVGPVPPSNASVQAQDDMSLRFRAGYLVGKNWLIYGTLGYSEQDVDVTSTCPADTTVCNPAVGTQIFKDSKTMSGATYGLGVETLVAEHWQFRAEYRLTDYGDFSFRAIPPTVSTFGADAEVDVETEIFEIGAAYKF